MKARVSITIPKFKTSNDDDSGGSKKSPSNKSSSRRKKLLSVNQQPNLKSVLSSSSTLQSEMADSQRMDHHNLPYSWRKRHSNEAEGEKSDADLRQSARKPRVRPLKGGISSKRLSLQSSSSTPQLNESLLSSSKNNDSTEEKEVSKRDSTESSSPTPTNISNQSQQLFKPPPPPIGSDEPVPTYWNQKSFTRLDQSKMPLEAFDDASMESKSGTPQEWLETCRTGRVKYYAEGVWRWRRVTINSYNEETNRFNVTFDGPAEIKKRLTKDVRRLDLLFSDEDQSLFEARKVAAEEYRETFKASLRLRTYMDNVYNTERVDLSKIENKTMNKIVNAAYGGATFAKQAELNTLNKRKQELEDGEKRSGPTLSEQLIEAVSQRYDRAQGKSSLKYQLKTNQALRKEVVESKLRMVSILSEESVHRVMEAL